MTEWVDGGKIEIVSGGEWAPSVKRCCGWTNNSSHHAPGCDGTDPHADEVELMDPVEFRRIMGLDGDD